MNTQIASDTLLRYAIDVKDLSKAVARYEQLMSEELSDAALPAARAVTEAWAMHTAHVQVSFEQKIKPIIKEIATSPVIAKRKAELLAELFALGEKTIAKAPKLFFVPDMEQLAQVLGENLMSPSMVIRVFALQAIMPLILHTPFVVSFFAQRGHQFLGMCMDRASPQESEAALNVLQRLLEVRLTSSVEPPLPLGLCYRVASMIDTNDELPSLLPQKRFRACQLALLMVKVAPAQAAAADIVRLLFAVSVYKTVTTEESEIIVSALLAAFDDPRHRSYIKDNDLSPVFAPFTDSTYKDIHEHISIMNNCKEVLCRIMTTWTGLLWVASEGIALRALNDVLHLPGPLDRKMVLITFFSQLLQRLAPHRGMAPLPQWLGVDMDRRQRAATVAPTDFDVVDIAEEFSTADMFSELVRDDQGEEAVATTKSVGFNPMDTLLGAALLVLDHHGLPHALISIVKRSADDNTNNVLTQEAAVLFQHILVLMDTTLPRNTGLNLHSALSCAVAELSQQGNVLVGSLTTKLFHQLGFASAQQLAAKTDSVAGIVVYTQNPLQIDEQTFQSMVKDSHVEQGEFQRWNFDILSHFVQGPLRQLPRLRWVRDNTRFFTRVLGFYRPSPTGRCFGSLKREDSSAQLCGFGIAIVDLLLSTREGAEIIEKSDLVKSLKQILQEVLEGKAQMLAKDRLNSTAAAEYLRFIGRFTSCAYGLELLRKHGLLDTIQSLYSDLQKGSSDEALRDVCHRLLPQLCLTAVPNFGVCEQIRICVRLALQGHSCTLVRLCAAMQLKMAMWRDLSSSMHWGIERLIDGIQDTAYSVVECCFKLLTSICSSSNVALVHLISKAPRALVSSTIIIENRVKLSTNSLLYRVVSVSEGFDFLDQHGWVEKELAMWASKESEAYVDEIERLQSFRPEEAKKKVGRTFSDPVSLRRGRGTSVATHNLAKVSEVPTFPLHFIGALCSSEKGCRLFLRSQFWSDVQHIVLENTAPIKPETPIVSRPQSMDELDHNLNHTVVFMPEVEISEPDPAAFAEEDAFDLAVELETNDQSPSSAKFGGAAVTTLGLETSKLLSSGKAYAARFTATSILCKGNMKALKAAIYALGHMGASPVGLESLRKAHHGVLIQRLLDLASFASCLSVRGAAFSSLSLIARSSAAPLALAKENYNVVTSLGGYMTSAGVPFSVAFAHPCSSSWMHVSKERKCMYAPLEAYRNGFTDYTDTVPKEIAEPLFSISNPVGRDGSKSKLHMTFKEYPERFSTMPVCQMSLDFGSMYRMRHQDRLFCAELLMRSLTPPVTPPSKPPQVEAAA